MFFWVSVVALCGSSGGPSPAAARGLRGNNDIHRAAARGSVGAVRHLLQTVPGAVAATDRAWTALHYAAYAAHVEVCRVLLAAGAQLDARDAYRPSAENRERHARVLKGRVVVVCRH